MEMLVITVGIFSGAAAFWAVLAVTVRLQDWWANRR